MKRKLILLFTILVLLMSWSTCFAIEDNEVEWEEDYYDGPEYFSNDEYEYIIEEDESGNKYIMLMEYIGKESNVIIPDYIDNLPVGSITHYMFYGNQNLKSIKIGNNVKYLGVKSFYNCSNLENVVLPKNLVTCGESSFRGCISLQEIIIPDTIEEIEESTFRECTSLKEIIIGKNVKNIGESAFLGCTNLTDLVIGDNVTNIGYYAFQGCTNLQNVILGKKLTDIGFYAFQGCLSLKDIVIPDSVKYIKSDAFQSCSNLAEIMIGPNVEEIGYYVFAWCTNLRNINVDSKNNNYMSEDGILFTKDKKILKQYPAAKNEASYKIPDGVIEIEEMAFRECQNLKTIFVPQTVENIDTNSLVEIDNLIVEFIDIDKYMFDMYCYARENDDVRFAYGYDEEKLKNHYLMYGIQEGRIATPIFDAKYYLNKYSDLRKEYGNNYQKAYNHFKKYGIIEGRQGSECFDVKYYLENNYDVSEKFKNDYILAAGHFVKDGYSEGRQGSREGSPITIEQYLFDANFYYNKYDDLKKAYGMDEEKLQQHYYEYGIIEGRQASKVFNPVYYLERNQDVGEYFGKNDYGFAYHHFCTYGIYEGRISSEDFNVKYYLNAYTDVKEAYGKNYSRVLEHFIKYGINEGREGNAN